jgi:hypothetical protein
MAHKLRPRDDTSDGDGTGGDGGDVPRVLFTDLGFRGAGWDIVDGRPVIVVDESLSSQDKTRYLAVAMNDIYARFARFRSHGGAGTAYTATT